MDGQASSSTCSTVEQKWSDEDVDNIVTVFTRELGSLKKLPSRSQVRITFKEHLVEVLQRKTYQCCCNKIKHLVVEEGSVDFKTKDLTGFSDFFRSWMKIIEYREISIQYCPKVSYHLLSRFARDVSHFSWESLKQLLWHILHIRNRLCDTVNWQIGGTERQKIPQEKFFKCPSLIKLGYWLDLSISKLVSSC